jgi:O-antigen chain-terminating methyltransferase
MPDWQRLWENREALPSTSHRRFLGPLLMGLKRLFRPLGDFLLSSRLETQREFNLHLLREMGTLTRRVEDLPRDNAEMRADIQKIQSWYQERFSELQKEVLTLRDGTVPALLKAQELGLKGADLKAEWALARIIQLRQMLEKGVDLAPAERSAATRGLTYAQFEDEFRGTPQEIREKQKPYLKELAGKGKVLDLGCGRGEFLELLKENNIPCLGVEKNPAIAALLKEKGLPFAQKDVFEFLGEPGEAFGAVAAFHFIEHFMPDAAFALLKAAFSRLSEGGVLILETPNPTSLAAFLNFHKDPEHKTPWHPDTLKYYLKQAGFKDIRVEFLHPFPPRPDVSLPKDLTNLLLGFQDYAVIAVK